MRAWLLHKPAPIETNPLVLSEVPDPKPGPGEVLLRVHACAICRTDLHVVEGDLQQRVSPITPGHQVIGEVTAIGAGVTLSIGERRGVAWLQQTCHTCRFCRTGRENLCDAPALTGWTRPGGFAEYIVAPAETVYPIPVGFADLQAAPLLCAGIIGYRALCLTGLGYPSDCGGARLGLYGFGAAGHVVIQLALARGMEVFVMTRDIERHQRLAAELGARWVGRPTDQPPQRLDAAIIFAPAGELVAPAVRALDKGGTLVLGGIHMSPLPPLEYRWLFEERVIRSVTNNTWQDGHALLQEAARIPIRTSIQTFPFEDANQALAALRYDAIRGAGVLLGPEFSEVT
jgi:propanol-preferring alcohol dehydrogenase